MKVKIKNFQSLKDVEFDIQGLTVITGQNNTGKSAIARAIYGAFKNTKGNYFVRNGEKNCQVDLEFDGNTITWEKGKKINRYTINGQTLDKVGSGVPSELQDLGIKSVDVDGRTLYPQFARQFEQIFLLDLPPSSLSSALSDVEVINKIDKANALCRKEIKEINSKLRVKREDLEHEGNKLKALQDEDSNFLDELMLDLHEKKVSMEDLISKSDRIEHLSRKREKVISFIDILNDANQILISDVEELERDSRVLEKLIRNKKKIVTNKIKEGMIGVGLLSYPSFPSIPTQDTKDLERLLRERNKALKTVSIDSDLKDLPVTINIPPISSDEVRKMEKRIKINDAIHKVEDQLQMMDSELNHISKHLIDSECPLCNHPLKEGIS